MKLSDLDILKEWLYPGQEWQNTDGPYYPRATVDEIDAMVGRWRQAIIHQSRPELRTRLGVVDVEDDMIIGMVSRYWISKETDWTAIGISIYDPKNWGKGYGYEALVLWYQYLFDNEPKFVRFDLRTFSLNVGMMKLSEKLGHRLCELENPD